MEDLLDLLDLFKDIDYLLHLPGYPNLQVDPGS